MTFQNEPSKQAPKNDNKIFILLYYFNHYPPYEGKGQRFESSRVHHKIKYLEAKKRPEIALLGRLCVRHPSLSRIRSGLQPAERNTKFLERRGPFNAEPRQRGLAIGNEMTAGETATDRRRV